MKIIAACAAAAIALTMSAPAMAEDHQTDGEMKLAKMLEGRVAGDPQRCITMFPNVDLTIIDGTALVYKRGRTLWVNVPRDAKRLDDRDTLVTRRTGSQLCSTDIVTAVELHTGTYTGNVFLTEFVPYRKAS